MGPRNFQRELDQLIDAQDGKRPTLLLHSCCGPCSSYVLEYLSVHFDVILYFDNPNIYPEAEYLKRLEAQKAVLAHLAAAGSVTLLTGPYDPLRYEAAVAGLESLGEGSARCAACFRLRLERAAEKAKALGADYFASTLSISPHKNTMWINTIGEEIAERVGIAHLPNDFKKRGGFQRSTMLCRDWGIYRQSYCGCKHSLSEQVEKAAIE